MKKTDWFPSYFPPSRPGYYETRTPNYPKPLMRKFNFGVWWVPVEDFGLCRSAFGAWPDGEWRGLAEKPE